MDYGALPPEVNSVRLYAGSGSGSLVAAASAWDGLAAELRSASVSYSQVVRGLAAGWLGPSSMAMAAAAAPFVAWLAGAAGRAEQAGGQARAAASAYESALAATVPPGRVGDNRVRLQSLVATNVAGQNIPAIAATESAYAEMWAQDAAAMYGYAGSSASAAQVTPFHRPPQNSDPAAASAATMSAAPHALQALTTPAQAGGDASLLSALNEFIIGPLSPFSYPYFVVPADLLAFDALGIPLLGADIADTLAAAPGGGGLLLRNEFGSGGAGASAEASPARTVSAELGRSGTVGRLSVPPGWASTAPPIRSAAAALPHSSPAVPAASMAAGRSNPYRDAALSGLVGRALAGTGGARPGGGRRGPVGKRAATANIFFVTPETHDGGVRPPQ